MKRPVKLGFVPLSDAAALIVAQVKGFFADEGLEVELSREVSWATIRDKVAVGALDGAHMLAPLALASTLGLGGHAAAVVAPMVLNRGGAAVTLSAHIAGSGDPAVALRRLVTARRGQGSSPPTFAVVFPHSIHAYLLRRWLADAGIDPELDVRITVAPPPRMADLLAKGVIEGFCAGEPWNAAAEAAGVGQVAIRASAIWPNALDKVLGLQETWATAEPEAVGALLRSLAAAAQWTSAGEHRSELLDLLARPEHIGLAPDILAAGIDEIRFAGPAANASVEADAVWLVAQMSRWGRLEPRSDAAAAARRTFRPDIYAAALTPPTA